MIEEGNEVIWGKRKKHNIIHEDDKIMLREYVQKRLMERIDKPKRPNTK